ncbi:MAG: THUMP domain-containing protein [Candidatus Thorarchaeota archaeon]|nr:MAG: THUMP domain-containing protein [Candidatus Thorarchaeota archaeon]
MRRSQLQEFNLLVGCPRDREQAARSEVQYFIGDLLEDDGLKVYSTRISGLITCMTTLDPFDVVKRLREYADENPYQFRFAIRFTPLELCVESSLEQITQAAARLLPKIDKDSTFRVTVRRRHTTLENMEIVEAVAEKIPRKVNLENPDKTVWIEVVGELTGISVLVEDDILSVMTLRDDMY